MYGKLLIRCELEVVTGLHIGDSSAFSAIGAVDSRSSGIRCPACPSSRAVA